MTQTDEKLARKAQKLIKVLAEEGGVDFLVAGQADEFIERALAACALEEAKWWADEFHHEEACDLSPAECVYGQRLATLEQQASGKEPDAKSCA